MEHNFHQLLQRHEMGQAYKRITEQMGPSAQLIAFVNYTAPQTDHTGLESFALEAAHDKILADIDLDPSYSMALEGFSGQVISFLTKVKNTITLNKHDKDLVPFITKPLKPRTSKVYVHTFSKFLVFQQFHLAALHHAEEVLRVLPTTTSREAWQMFLAKHVGLSKSTGVAKFGMHAHELLDRAKSNTWFSDVEFEKSEWDETNFKANLRKYNQTVAKSQFIQTKIRDVLHPISELLNDYYVRNQPLSVAVSHNTKDDHRTVTTTRTNTTTSEDADVLRALHAAHSTLVDIWNLLVYCRKMEHSTLKNVSQHFAHS